MLERTGIVMANGTATDQDSQHDVARVAISVRNDLAELGRIGDAVGELARRCGWPDAFARDLELALDEVVTNIISYAYEDGAPHMISIALALSPGVVTAEVSDDGRAFDPTEAPEAVTGGAVRERPVGGLGWHLVRAAVDTLAYRRDQGRNVVTMTKRTQQAPGN